MNNEKPVSSVEEAKGKEGDTRKDALAILEKFIKETPEDELHALVKKYADMLPQSVDKEGEKKWAYSEIMDAIYTGRNSDNGYVDLQVVKEYLKSLNPEK